MRGGNKKKIARKGSRKRKGLREMKGMHVVVEVILHMRGARHRVHEMNGTLLDAYSSVLVYVTCGLLASKSNPVVSPPEKFKPFKIKVPIEPEEATYTVIHKNSGSTFVIITLKTTLNFYNCCTAVSRKKRFTHTHT